MAEVQQDSGGGKGRSKKMSTKVDMTPMVDLAFLLITFFMLTTTLGQPNTMEVNMPDKTENNDTDPLKESRAFTLLLGKDDNIYYYQGLTDPELEVTDFSSDGVRKVITQKQKEIDDMVVLIKATEDARFKNVVDILDEMSITGSKKYAVIDITDVDRELIKNFNNPEANNQEAQQE